MNCKRIEELMMTDYVDGQMNDGLHKEITSHLNTCARCRKFEESLRQNAIAPFKKIKEVRPPEFIWQKIRERIFSEGERKGALAALRERLAGLYWIPKPVWATALVMLLMFALFLTRASIYREKESSYLIEQAEFVTYGNAEFDDAISATDADLGTSMEIFLL